MNGTAPGAGTRRPAYGLINAVNAINAIDVLRVLSTDPANGSTVTVTPSAITVTFSKPVDFSTVSSSDLVFTAAPAGRHGERRHAHRGRRPQVPDDHRLPVQLQLHQPADTTANGTYTFIVTMPTPPPRSSPRTARPWFPRARSPSRSPT